MSEPKTLREICMQSCEDMYRQMEVLQKVAEANDDRIPGMVTTDVTNIEYHPGYIKLILRSRIMDPDGLKVLIGKQPVEGEVTFDNYDETVPSINIFASEAVLSKIRNAGPSRIILSTNLKWLIKRTLNTYEECGDQLGFPKVKPSFSESEYDYPEGVDPSDKQREAVRTVLNSSLSYVWGAPGTGKTQLVLATAIMAYLKKGKRVLVVAPTNNAVEQVMRGLLKAIEGDSRARRYIDIRKDVIRMGLATSSFFNDYPNVCERRNTTESIGKLEDKIKDMRKLLEERAIQRLSPDFDRLGELLEEREHAGFLKRRSVEKDIKASITDLRSKISAFERYEHLLDNVDATNITTQFYGIRNNLFNRSIPLLDVDEYRDLSDSDIEERIEQCTREIRELRDYQSVAKMDSAKIIGMTPHLLMNHRKHFMSDEGPSIDHIFVDEAGYANLIQTLPVFMIGAPVTFLGDHMQLTPVCNVDRGSIRTWFKRDDPYMHYAYLWDVPVLYAEYVLSNQPDVIGREYIANKVPELEMTVRISLTESFRFGQNLARALNRCVYHNGIVGRGGGTLTIDHVDARCEEEGRSNLAEVHAIADYIKTRQRDLGSFVVLTPYTDQVEALRKGLPNFRDDIMTVHRSQGREWDTVILSVRDNKVSTPHERLTFTSTVKTSDGVRVINTAVSRAKKRLVIVCDEDYWLNRVDGRELIRNLLSEAIHSS